MCNSITYFFYSEPQDTLKALGDYQETLRPVAINFNEMTTLMNQCQQVEESKTISNELVKNITSHPISGRGILANNPFVLLSGIIPGKYINIIIPIFTRYNTKPTFQQ